MTDYSFKVGDKVRHDKGHYGFEISEVIGITPKGFVKVRWGNNSFLTFYPDGSQRGGDTWAYHFIKPVSQDDYDEAEKERLTDLFRNKTNWRIITLENLRCIYKIITGETP